VRKRTAKHEKGEYNAMKNAFDACRSDNAVKALYAQLLPAVLDDVAAKAALDAQYTEAVARTYKVRQPAKSARAYEFVAQLNETVRRAIERAFRFDTIEAVEVCGYWVWADVQGNAEALKPRMKAIGYTWSVGKGRFFFAGCPANGTMDMPKIRQLYGSQMVTREDMAGAV
jgi:hypothetical protein